MRLTIRSGRVEITSVIGGPVSGGVPGDRGSVASIADHPAGSVTEYP
jgi:hypothetical protein